MKVAVTGAAGGIGSTVVSTLIDIGHTVFGVDRRSWTDGCTAREIADVTDPAAVERAFAAFGPVDALVTCAGWTSGAPAHLTDPADWHAVIDANLTSAFLCARAVLPGMVEAGGGVIVTLGSVHGHQASPGFPAYAAAKAGLIGFTRQLAVDYGRFGVRAVSISPGWIRTKETETRLGGAVDEARLRDSVVLPELGRPDDIAGTVAFLVSPAARSITGIDLVIDAGASAVQTAAVLRPAFRARMDRDDLR
jgi:3-oxoacyl-[acyl-carrier protein] reductase